jgi:hypothetical protein
MAEEKLHFTDGPVREQHFIKSVSLSGLLYSQTAQIRSSEEEE